MAREHAAMARSPDCFAQVYPSSAAATVGNPARATTAKHANNQYADERICIACGLRTLTGGAGIADLFPWALIRPLVGAVAQMVHQGNWSLGFRFGSKTVLVAPKRHFRSTPINGHRQLDRPCPK